MDFNISHKTLEKSFSARERKHPYALKDVKRKLSIMNKKIDDLHHQRKSIYKNSVKVKRMVHNQVNQIVKCLRARERCLWSDIDEMFVSQDNEITEKLCRFQSLYAHCQALLSHLEDFKGNVDILAKVHSILAQDNFEKNFAMQLEFISDFEGMKTKADNYGCLRNNRKNEEFIPLSQKNGSSSSDITFNKFHYKDEYNFKTLLSKNDSAASSSSNSLTNKEDCNDFQIISLLENISCHDSDDDFIKIEHEIKDCCLKEDKEFCDVDEFRNDMNVKTMKKSNELYQGNKDFDPEEEWKQIFEMNKTLASFNEISSKFSKEKIMQHNVKNDLCISKTNGENHNNFKHNVFSSEKEASYWLQNKDPKSDSVAVEKDIEKVNFKSVYPTPAEIIQNAFQHFLKKDNPQIWLSSH